MSDIVKRLRANLLDAPHLMGYDKRDMAEAIAEIERLRAALKKIAAVEPRSWTTDVAREALNNKMNEREAAEKHLKWCLENYKHAETLRLDASEQVSAAYDRHCRAITEERIAEALNKNEEVK
jgi:hypothetical protein